jgi:MFS family permease
MLTDHPSPPRFLGQVLGLVTATDFAATLSLLVASEPVRKGLHATPGQFIWIFTAYAATGMVVIPLIERLARRWHYRSLMAAGLLLFLVGALGAAASHTVAQAVFARALQGLGGGGLFTMSRVYLQLAVPAPLRARCARDYLVGLFGGTALVPWLTAALAEGWGWRAVFLLQGALALPVLAITWSHLKAERHTPRSLGRVDWPMILSFALGMLLLLHGLEDWTLRTLDSSHLVLFAVAVTVLVFAVRRLHRDADPLLDMRVLNGRRYLVGLGFYGFYYLINGATSFLYPKLFRSGLDLSFTATGALLSLAAGTTFALIPLLSLLRRFKDRRRVIAAGFALAALALVWMALKAGAGTAFVDLLAPMVLKGLFPLLVVVQIAGLTYHEVAHEDFIHAYALKNIMRQLAGVFAVGLASHGWQALAAVYQGPRTLLPVLPVVEQQTALAAGRCLLFVLAGLCLLGIPLIVGQKRLV